MCAKQWKCVQWSLIIWSEIKKQAESVGPSTKTDCLQMWRSTSLSVSAEVEDVESILGPAIFCGVDLTVGVLGVAAGIYLFIRGRMWCWSVDANVLINSEVDTILWWTDFYMIHYKWNIWRKTVAAGPNDLRPSSSSLGLIIDVKRRVSHHWRFTEETLISVCFWMFLLWNGFMLYLVSWFFLCAEWRWSSWLFELK